MTTLTDIRNWQGVPIKAGAGPYSGVAVGSKIFTENFANLDQWTAQWMGTDTDPNVNPISTGNATVSGGIASLLCNTDGVGALLSTNPDGGASPGFQMGLGYIEMCIYLPGTGWGTGWSDGQDWPADGENDIIEWLGSATSNYHYGTDSDHESKNSGTIAGTWDDNYHYFAVHRQDGTNDIWWDTTNVWSYTTDDGGADHYLILNHGIASYPGGDDSGAGSTFRVASVNAWDLA
jgi:hypothetical protein